MTSEATIKDNKIIITRIVDAPRELVWQVWSNPEHIALWWGPDGFTNTIFEMDFRTGGVWRYMMHGPDGTDYPNKIVYEEIVEPEFIKYAHGEDVPDDEFKPFYGHTTFEDLGGKTRVTLNLRLDSAETVKKMVEFGAVDGGKQTLARLDEYLKALQKHE